MYGRAIVRLPAMRICAPGMSPPKDNHHMKRRIPFTNLTLSIGVIVIILSATLLWKNHSELFAFKKAESQEKTVEVEALAKQPDRYRGPIQVRGVVSAVSPEQKMLALIDRKEVEACGVTTCATLFLPVLWEGPLPRVGEQILVKGEVRPTDAKKLVFVASALDKLPFGSTKDVQQ